MVLDAFRGGRLDSLQFEVLAGTSRFQMAADVESPDVASLARASDL